MFNVWKGSLMDRFIKIFVPSLALIAVFLFMYVSYQSQPKVVSGILQNTISAKTKYESNYELRSLVEYGRSIDTLMAVMIIRKDSLQKEFFYRLAKDVGKEYDINHRLLYGIWMRESEMDPKARGDGRRDSTGVFIAGTWKAFGLGQVHLRTAREHYDPTITNERLLDPIENGYASGATLRDYIGMFDFRSYQDNVKYGLASYQQGPFTTKKQLSRKKQPGNMNYIVDVLLHAIEVN